MATVIGQIITPATTAVNREGEGTEIRVLASFSSEMDVRNHLEQLVKPWLSVNVTAPSRAGTRSVTLLGALEDADPGLMSSTYEMMREALGFEFGQLSQIKKPWEERRALVADALRRAMPFWFRPCLQLDPTDARPLAEALNKPFYEKRDTRNPQERENHCLVSALSLMLCRAELWRARPKNSYVPRLPPSWMSM
jgi:hypothetical protein